MKSVLDEHLSEFVIQAFRTCQNPKSVSKHYCLETAVSRTTLQTSTILVIWSRCLEIIYRGECFLKIVFWGRKYSNPGSFILRRKSRQYYFSVRFVFMFSHMFLSFHMSALNPCERHLHKLQQVVGSWAGGYLNPDRSTPTLRRAFRV